MKTIFRVAAFGLVTAAFLAVSAVSSFAQDPCADTFEVKTAKYEIFKKGRTNTDKAPRTLELAKPAITAGEEFISKYGKCEDSVKVAEFITKNLPEIKEWVKRAELIARFDDSIADPKNIKADQAFSSGKELIALIPTTNFDVSIVLAMIGFDNSIKNPPVDTYNNETINYAKIAIKEAESGKTSTYYGAKSKILVINTGNVVDPGKSKNNVLARMNYIIGSIMYYNQKKEKDALSYFYKAAQIESDVKTRPDIYQAIGGWYLKELVGVDKERLAAIVANNNQDNEQSLALLAMEKGLAERAINALSKAHKFASAEFKTGIYGKLQELYKVRFDEKKEGLDAYIATASNQPLADPATPVTPIVEAPPTTTSSTTNTPTTTPTTNPTTKPSTTPTTTPVTTKPTTTTTPVTTKPTTTTTTKPAAKVNTKPKATVSKKKAIR